MSPLTSLIACSWSGVSSNGNASSISCCHGVSGPKARPGVASRWRYSTTSSSAISRTALRHARPLLLEVGAAHAVQRGGLAAGVLADQSHLVGGHVDLAVLELEPQVVAFDATHAERLHLQVATDPVLVVHDVVARFERVVVVLTAARAARPAVHASATGEVGLGHERELRAGEDDAAFERRDRQPHRARRGCARGRRRGPLRPGRRAAVAPNRSPPPRARRGSPHRRAHATGARARRRRRPPGRTRSPRGAACRGGRVSTATTPHLRRCARADGRSPARAEAGRARHPRPK